MCDKETRLNFRWSHVLEGVSIVIMIALVTVVIDMRDAYKSSEELHASIPPGFFTKDRYGVQDAIVDRKLNESERDVLEQRIQTLERLSTAHYKEAEVWKQTIRDTVESLKSLERLMWERDRERNGRQ